MATISLCMITKNEENFLPKCLDSVREIVDEIIIVDTGSSDKTIEIAKKYTDKVYSIKWENDFSNARNESLKHATKDWILVLDADETIAKKDIQRIKELLNEKEYMGFAFVQRSYMNESMSLKWVSPVGDDYDESKPYAGWMYAGITRLFRNDPRIRFEFPVHETVMESIERIGGRIKKTDIPIHHYGKVRGKDFVEKKSKMYFELGKKKIEVSPKAKSYFELAVQAQVLNNYDVAIENFKKAIELNPQWAACYVNLGNLYIKKKMIGESIEALEKAIELQPNNSSAYNNLGIAYEKSKEFEKAFQSYQKAIQTDSENVLAYSNIARILVAIKKFDEAIMVLEKILELNPKDIFSYNNLEGLYLQKGNTAKAIEILQKGLEIEPDNTYTIINLGMLYLKNNNKSQGLM